ncbi:MAG: hypothetical protein CMH57_04175 [Myxococcales bacterium]|nr:hypothetical protein [Myxococcales bacterium]
MIHTPPTSQAALTAALTALAVVLTGSLAGAQPLSMDAAIDAALLRNLQDRQQLLRIDEALATSERSGARYLPQLQVEGNAVVWDDELTLSLGGASPALPAPQTPYEEAVAGLFSALSTPSTIRDQVTADLQVALVQPLVQLYPIHLAHQLDETNVEVARLERRALRQAITLNTAVVWLQLQLTDQLIANAQLSLDTLDAQTRRVEALVRAGAAVRADALRVKVARANSQSELIRLGNARAMALAQLALLMDQDLGDALTLTPIDSTGAPPKPPVPLSEAIDQAHANRVQLDLFDLQRRRAGLGEDLARAEYLPEVALIGAYQHTQGQGLANPNQFYAGVSLRWTAFEWGATRHGVEVAQLRAQNVELARQYRRQQIELEVRDAWLDLDTARAAWAVADSSIAEAEEVYQNEQARLAQGATTTVDLVASEAALNSARNARSIAWTNAAIATAQLRFAMGDTVRANTVLLR